jgi:uncharacterized protein YjbI with pentapeptide repeats
MSVVAILLACGGALLATAVGRAAGAGWLSALGLATLFGVGLCLWIRDPNKGWGDLGQGVMVSVAVAVALMAVQRDADDRTRATEASRQNTAERQSLQLALTLKRDLRGIALADRDLHGFFLADRNLDAADLHGADLRGADLHGARFREASLVSAKLDAATVSLADLRGAVLVPDALVGDTSTQPDNRARPATFRKADLERANLRRLELGGVNFRGALLAGADLRDSRLTDIIPGDRATFRNAFLVFADLQNSFVGSVDFRGATLGGARFCGARDLRRARLEGARYDDTTRWPRGFDPKSRGAKRGSGSEATAMGPEARRVRFRNFDGWYDAGVIRLPNSRLTRKHLYPPCS